MAVPPDLVGFVESAGLAAVGYGPDSQEQVNAVADFVHHAFTPQNPISLVRAGRELFVEGWAQMSRTLDFTRGRGGSAGNRPDLPRSRRQRRRVLRHSGGGTPPLPDPRQWPARPSVDTVAGTSGPLLVEGGLVAVLAHNQGRRRRATPRTGPTESIGACGETDGGTWIARDPGLRRGLLSGPRGGMERQATRLSAR